MDYWHSQRARERNSDHWGLHPHQSNRCLQRLIVDFLKNRVGRLRPDFADRVSEGLKVVWTRQTKDFAVPMEWHRVHWVRTFFAACLRSPLTPGPIGTRVSLLTVIAHFPLGIRVQHGWG